MAAVGAFTAILAATIALVQNDIKRVLAYSTVSQLGYMFLALGVGAYWVAVFHLFTHAFFKALLFLGSGSVIHAMGGEQDMRHMGGLKNKIPITHWTMLVGVGGHRRHPRPGGLLLQGRDPVAGLQLAAGLEAAVGRRPGHRRHDRVLHVAADEHDVLRQVAREARSGGAHPRIARLDDRAADRCWRPAACWPAGWDAQAVDTFGESFRGFERWLEPAFASAAVEAAKEGEHAASIEWMLMGVSVAVAVIGIVVARYFYHHKPEIPDTHRKPLKPLHGLLYNKWYVDEIYDFLFVNGLCKGGGTRAGRVRPQRGGWRRQRRRLADALHLHASRSGGTPGSSTARCASAPSS